MRNPDETQRIGRLKHRADFVRAGKGRRWHGKSVSVQAAARGDGAAGDLTVGAAPRVGFTLTKKVGCAVIRNRARRRLREAMRLAQDLPARAGYDYVFIGRLDAIRLPFDEIKREMSRAIRGVHDDQRQGSRHPGGPGPRKTKVKP